MRAMTVTQADTGTWAADSSITTDIEEVGLITRLSMTCEITPSATLTGANQPDGIFRLVGNMRIYGSNITYFNLPATDGGQAGTLLHYMNQLDGLGLGHPDAAVAAPVQLHTPMTWHYHCGSRPQHKLGWDNPFDLSAFIPASEEGQLRAEWTTYGNDVMDDTVTISSAIMRFTINRISATEPEIRTEMAAQELMFPQEHGVNGMIPVWSAVVHANAGTTSDFDAEQINIVAGAFLKRIAFLNQDATGDRPLRAGDQVTRVAVRVPETNEDLYRAYLDQLISMQSPGSNLTINSGASESAATEKFGVDFNNAVPQGVVILDLRPRAKDQPWGKDYGWDMRGLANDSFRLGLFINARAAGDDTLTVFERYQPYFGHLAS